MDADVNAVLTSWKVRKQRNGPAVPVTLRQLLSHSAGLTVHGFGGYPYGAQLPTLRQILDGLPPANSSPIVVAVKPGTKHIYSGGGYCVVQQLLIDTTHTAFPDLMRQMLLGKIKMADSTYMQPLPPDAAACAARGYGANGSEIVGGCHVYPEMAAAGLWTTPSDLALFIIDVEKAFTHKNGGGLLPQEMATEMLKPQAGNCGLGLFLTGAGKRLSFNHSGSNDGYRCRLIGYPHTGQGLVVMTNSDNGDSLIDAIVKAVSREYKWP